MSGATGNGDLLDRIANDLPAEIRANYYRELTYCRSLPENDELLRVLRAMQFLLVLMQQIPERVAAERAEFARLFEDTAEQLRTALEGTAAYQARLEERLAGLPGEVLEGIRPEAIAREINENLRQQFVESTIPQTAQALSVTATQLKASLSEFVRTASAISSAHQGTAEQARQAIAHLDSTVSRAASTAKAAAAELSTVFQREFRWSLYALSGLALVLGMGLGMWCQRWMDTPAVRQPAAPVERVR